MFPDVRNPQSNMGQRCSFNVISGHFLFLAFWFIGRKEICWASIQVFFGLQMRPYWSFRQFWLTNCAHYNFWIIHVFFKIFHLAWNCLFLSELVQSCLILSDLVCLIWSFTYLASLIWSCPVLFDLIRSCLILFDLASLIKLKQKKCIKTGRKTNPVTVAMSTLLFYPRSNKFNLVNCKFCN